MNDAGLTMGESTCAARIAANAPVVTTDPSTNKTTSTPAANQVHVSDLTQVAFARCSTARCAINVMGAVAEKHGFSGDEGADGGSAGEALTIGDGKEAWVFNVLPDGEKGAVWVAQRVGGGPQGRDGCPCRGWEDSCGRPM